MIYHEDLQEDLQEYYEYIKSLEEEYKKTT